jgi:hypothetical protein
MLALSNVTFVAWRLQTVGYEHVKCAVQCKALFTSDGTTTSWLSVYVNVKYTLVTPSPFIAIIMLRLFKVTLTRSPYVLFNCRSDIL